MRYGIGYFRKHDHFVKKTIQTATILKKFSKEHLMFLNKPDRSEHVLVIHFDYHEVKQIAGLCRPISTEIALQINKLMLGFTPSSKFFRFK